VRRRLLASHLQGRTEGAAERRMQNITAVLNRSFGIVGIDGYKPLHQTGIGQGAVIRASLLRHLPELSQPLSEKEIEERILVSRHSLRSAPVVDMPWGNHNPMRQVSSANRYSRDVEVAAWVLEQAEGHCESCGCVAPFCPAVGEPYLEVHHVRQLA